MTNGVSRALLCAAFLVPALGQAQEAARPQSAQFNYNYAEISYDELDFDVGPFDVDADGLTLSGSFELTDDWHVYASYGSYDLDPGNADVDTWTLGAGYVYPLKDDIDIYGRVLYIDQSSDVGGLDEDGLGLQARIRARVTDEWRPSGSPTGHSPRSSAVASPRLSNVRLSGARCRSCTRGGRPLVRPAARARA